ncbi:MAG: hypothetical protein A3D92_10540 [Bacteroidetes bacterium RIFCSPHIGHO2_02_FULL_44_7]|nr:MAG: hypothetical protein A3D92_10540 [Bacteroidetes bacterium RIFCSPHIGHO2_02_FULL_44_7]
MSAVELFFLNSGFSWTLSKALPYVLAVLLGIILVYLMRKRFRKNALLKWALRLVFLVIPFTLYFMYSPIYRGDFSNGGEELARDSTMLELTGNKLVVLTIPGCPFCYEAVDRMILLHDRLPEAQIEFRVCSSDPNTLSWYKDKGGEAIQVVLADSSTAMATLAMHRFPAFILVDGDNKPLKRWSNDSFGVSAMDEVELSLK